MKGRTNTKHTVLPVVTAIVLIAAALISMLIYQNSSERLERARAFSVLGDSASEQTAVFNAVLNGKFRLLEAFSGELASDSACTRDELIQRMDELSARMEAVVRSGEFTHVLISDAKGLAFDNSGNLLDVSKRAYFLSVMEGEQVLTLISRNLVNNEKAFAVAVPLTSGGEARGMVCGIFNESGFRDALISEAFGRSSYSFVCDPEGVVVVGDERSEFAVQGDDLREVLSDADFKGGSLESVISNIGAGIAGTAEYAVGGEHRCAVYRPLGVNGWMIFSAVPGSELDAYARTATRSGYILLGVVMFISLCFLALLVFTNRRAEKRLRGDAERLEASEERYRAALESTTLTIWDYDLKRRRIIQNDRSREQHGFEHTIDDVPQSLVDCGYVHPDSVQAFLEMYDRLFAGEQTAEGVFRMRTADRGDWWYEHIRYKNLFDSDGKPYLAIGMSDDITEKIKSQQEYERELRLQQAMAPEVFATALFDVSEWKMVRYTAGDENAYKLFDGYSVDDFFRFGASSVVGDEKTRELILGITKKAMEERFESGQKTFSCEYVRRTISGAEHWVRDEFHLMTDPSTGHLMMFVCIEDVDEEKRRLDTLARAAESDSMTGLLNHDATLKYMAEYLSGEGSDDMHAVFMVDLDHFKELNDTLGHQRGDELIIGTANAMRAAFRSTDIIGRVGGDEFMALMKNITDLSMVRKKAAELLTALQFTCADGENTLMLSGSIGVSVYEGDGKSAEKLYSEADAALYVAKTSGRNRFALSGGRGEAAAGPDIQPESASVVQLHTLLEYMDGGVLLTEVADEPRITYVSPSFFKTLRAGKESTGEELFASVCPDDLPALKASLRGVAATGRLYDGTYRVLEPDGGLAWRHIRTARLPSEGVPTLISVVTDVSDIKNSEKLLSFAEERYRVAMEQTGSMIWEVDIAAKTQRQSAGASKRFGHLGSEYENAPESIIAAGAIHPDSIDEFRKMYADLYAGDDSREYLIRGRDETGGYVWLLSRFSFLRDENGSPYYSVGIVDPLPNIDIDLRRVQQERLLMNQVEKILLGGVTANVTKDLVERGLYRGEEFSAEGRSFGELTASFAERIPDEKEKAEFLRIMLPSALISAFGAGKTMIFSEFRRRDADGPRWTSCGTHLIRHPASGDLCAFIYLRDVNRRRLREIKLGFEAERDSVTLLFTREAVCAMIRDVIATSSEGWCMLCVLEISGLGRITAEQGDAAARDIQFTIGRLLRILLDGDVVLGELDDSHAVCFRADIASASEAERRLADAYRRFSESLAAITGMETLELKYSYVTARASEAELDSMLAAAYKKL